MAYTNSPLTMAYVPSPHYSERMGEISKITVHHAAAVASAKQIANHFQAKSTRASANYVIGKDGEIIRCVDEKNRAWTSSNVVNDNMAVTIEVANIDTAPNWPISEKAWLSLVKLCVDICRRNKIDKLTYTGGPSGNLTLHRFFAVTECPGPTLTKRMPELVEAVNERLCPQRYMTVEELPDWGRPTVQRLMDAGALRGTDSGLDISNDMLRVLVVVDRMLGGAVDES